MFFQECLGEEVIDHLSQESTNQHIRKAASDLADKYFRGSLNDGISSDLFMQQSYHQTQNNMFNVKTDEERYFYDDCDEGEDFDEYNAAAAEAEHQSKEVSMGGAAAAGSVNTTAEQIEETSKDNVMMDFII